jgi:hypothetical protein
MADSREIAKQVICEIIAVSGGRLTGKLRLYKAFYFAHLYFWENNKGALTDHPIVRMPLGPGIDDGDALLEELRHEGKIAITQQFIGPYRELVYEIAEPIRLDPSVPRFKAIEEAVRWIEGKSASQLSEETHVFSRTWREGDDGQVLNIYLDILEESEYNRVKQGLLQAEDALSGIFD